MSDDQSPESQISSLKSEDSPPGRSERNSETSVSFTSSGLNRDHVTAEISGETIEVVGEATGQFPRPASTDPAGGESTGRHALMVGTGILISRIIGVIRQRAFAHYLGNSDAAGAFSAAFRIPNFLQNVFGEGALSASFIPVYANLLARGDKKEASRVADAVLTMLALTTSIIILVGVLTTPFFVGLFAYSFSEAARELTIELVRILFPGAGLRSEEHTSEL